jgi:3-oxoacyl-[acyl-carrier protein] reductase
MVNLAKHHKALITGGSRGLGSAMASLLEDQGVEVIAPTRDVLDLSRMESIAAYIASEQGTGFDIIINNAGINLLNELTHVKDEDWQIMLQVNLTAPMALIRGLAPYGILVNAVCPGYVETELTFVNNSPEQLAAITATIPLQRLAQPHEIAKLVSFLCSEENTYLTGQNLVIDGGFTCK